MMTRRREKKQPILVMAGGTGGHVFPALAVADYLKDQGEEIIWLGTKKGIESRLVPAADYPIEWISIQGLRGSGWRVKLMAPLRLVQACWQAFRILRRVQPRAALGMGGFASGPGGLVSWLLRIPLVIHEQNAVMGLTNKLLSRIARLCFFAFPQAAQGIKHSQVVGNPVRRDILDVFPNRNLADAGDSARPLRLLVLGGSLGARTLNQVVPAAVRLLAQQERPLIRHQCGAGHLQECQQEYMRHGVKTEVTEFIDDMSAAYAWADVVVCRAGALTIAEIAAAGLASILVPYPYAVDDHQYANARFLVDAGAAWVVRDHDFTAEYLRQQLTELARHQHLRQEMAQSAHAVAYTEATRRVGNGVLREALI